MSGAYQLFIRAITLTGLGFISYEIYESYKQEKRIRKLQAQRQYQISTGKEVDPRIEQEIDHYLDNHYGQRVLERMASRNVFEEQLRMQIQSKKDQRDQAKETGSEDQVKKLEDDIKKLNDLLGEVKSNKAVDVDSYGTMK